MALGKPPSQDKRAPEQQKSIPIPCPPPIGGWNARDALADMPPQDAVLMLDILPQPTQVITRQGAIPWVTGFSSPVHTLMPFNAAQSGASKQMFAAAGSSIYNVSAPGVLGSAVVTGLNSDWWQWVNFGTQAGEFLVAVNGVDAMLAYNGSTWLQTTSLPINGGGTLSLATIINIGLYQSTLYFIPSGQLGFYYQNAQSLFGQVTWFGLGALATRGGYLVAMATWTVDGGTGPQDYLVCITSEGEYIVFQGLSFATAIGLPGSMQLVGVYYIARPLGRRCWIKYGGDCLVLTERGLFPLSTALQSATVDKQTALTDKIEPAFVQLAAQTFGYPGWQIELCQYAQFLIISVPTPSPQQIVMQFQSKGWANWTVWQANCFLYFNGALYYGDGSNVYQAYYGNYDWVGGAQAPINSSFLAAFSQLKIPGQIKHVKAIRPYISATVNPGAALTYSIGGAVDYNLGAFNVGSVTVANPTVLPAGTGIWGTSLWGTGLWGGTIPNMTTNQINTIAVWPCQAFAPYFTFTNNGTGTVALTAYDVLVAKGGVL